MLIFQITLWLSLFIISWTYFGYYLTLWSISFFYSRKTNKQEFFPRISLVITAYNEERRIRQKIENTLALAYPKDSFEIIVVSDGSSDKTEELVRSFQDKGVKLLANPTRHGKHYSQGQGIATTKGEIIVLTDAATFLEVDAIEKIVRNFADPMVGCVSGVDRVRKVESNLGGEEQYVKYEMKLRTLESKVGSLVGVSGCFFAVRKKLCQAWHGDMSSDFYLPIISYMKGYRTILEAEAIGFYEVLKDPQEEFGRKVRTVVHGLEVLFKFREIMNPFKYGIYSCQMISHKLFRWLVPIGLILFFLSNLLLLDLSIFYQVVLAFQILFYLAVLFAFLVKRLQEVIIFKIPFFFVMTNASILVAWYKFLTGQRLAIWEPTRR
jgi:cellulose synthase/poly-beta-1,6-N-acetylglucosamine synthase-like glycosyltransferase